MLSVGAWLFLFIDARVTWAMSWSVSCSNAAGSWLPPAVLGSKFFGGLPLSMFWRKAVLMGMEPRKGRASRWAIFCAPPLPKMSYSLPSSPMK